MADKPKINLLKTPLLKSLKSKDPKPFNFKPKKPSKLRWPGKPPRDPFDESEGYAGEGPWKKDVVPPQEVVTNLLPRNLTLSEQDPWALDPRGRYIEGNMLFKVPGTDPRLRGSKAAYGQGSRTVEGYPLSFKGMGLQGQPPPEIKKQPRPIGKMSGGPLGTPLGYTPLGGPASLSDAPGAVATPAPLLLPPNSETADPGDTFDSDEITGLIDSAFDKAYFNYSQDDKMLNTGRQGFAETFWRLSDPTRPPIISDTPYVTGPQVNRATGEITEAPLSWLSLDRTPEGVSVVDTGTGTGIDDGIDTGIDDGFTNWYPLDNTEFWNPDYTPIDWSVDFDESDWVPRGYYEGEDDSLEGYGWGVPVGDDPSTLEQWLGFRYVDPGFSPAWTQPMPKDYPQTEGPPGTGREGKLYPDPVVIRFPRFPGDTSGLPITNISDSSSFGGGEPWSPYAPSKIIDSSKKLVTDVVGGIESMSDAIFGKTQYDQYPRPEKEKEVARLYGKAKDLVQGWSDEMFILWEQQGVPSSLGSRTPFGPDYIENAKNLVKVIKNEEGIKTQEYGKVQYLALLNLVKMVSTYGPMGAIPAVFVTLSRDIMSGLKNAFADHPEFRGNPVQDVIHGTTWVLGQTLKKTYNETLGRLVDKIDGDKLKENLSKLKITDYMKPAKGLGDMVITYDPDKPEHLDPTGSVVPETGDPLVSEIVDTTVGAGVDTGEIVDPTTGERPKPTGEEEPPDEDVDYRDEFKGEVTERSLFDVAGDIASDIVGGKLEGELETGRGTGRGEDKLRELERELEPEKDEARHKEQEEREREGVDAGYPEYRSPGGDPGMLKVEFPDGDVMFTESGLVVKDWVENKGGKLVKWGDEKTPETEAEIEAKRAATRSIEKGEIPAETLLKIQRQVELERRQDYFKENQRFEDDATNEVFSKGAYNWLEHGAGDFTGKVDTKHMSNISATDDIADGIIRLEYKYQNLADEIRWSAAFDGDEPGRTSALDQIANDKWNAIEALENQRPLPTSEGELTEYTTPSAIGIYLNNLDMSPEEAAGQAYNLSQNARTGIITDTQGASNADSHNFWVDINNQVSSQIFDIANQQRSAESANSAAESEQAKARSAASTAVTKAIKDKSDKRWAESQATAKAATRELTAYFKKLSETEPLLGAAGEAAVARLDVPAKIAYKGTDGGIVQIKDKDGKVVGLGYVDPDAKTVIDDQMDGWVSESQFEEYKNRNVAVLDPGTAYWPDEPSP
jgi:hypothetical protein